MAVPNGSIDIWNFVDNETGVTVRKWLRDSWARKKIVALQQAIAAIVVPTASTANPQMDGTAAPGVSTDYARADHVHPHDTSKADAATTYTKSQVDAMIPTVPTKTSDLTNDSGFVNINMFGVPTAIPSGADLNDYTTPGHYTAATGAIAGSLTNSPITVNFSLFVIYRTDTLMSQIMIASNRYLYLRYMSSSGWEPWYRFTGTAV